MGQPVNFSGSNVVMRAPWGAENVQDMHVFQTRHSSVSCWKVSAAELAEINRTGRIFLSVLMGGRQPPVYVGSESACRAVLLDFGPAWPIAPAVAGRFFNGVCEGGPCDGQPIASDWPVHMVMMDGDAEFVPDCEDVNRRPTGYFEYRHTDGAWKPARQPAP